MGRVEGGSVRKRPTGTWEARWYDPEGKQRSQNFKTKGEATRHIGRMLGDKDRGTYPDAKLARTPFRVVAEAWYLTTEGLKPKTRAGYRSILDYHLGVGLTSQGGFGAMAVKDINAGKIDEFIAGMNVGTQAAKPSTKRNVLRVLGMVMEHAVKKDIRTTNPVARANRPRMNGESHDDEDLNVLTGTQVAALADEVGPRYRLLVLFAAYTGMRAGEICALRVKDLDLMNRRATVRESVSDINGKPEFVRPKNGKTRKVALPRFLVEPLMEQVAGRSASALVFAGAGDQPMRHGNFYGRHFKPAVRRVLPEGLPGRALPGSRLALDTRRRYRIAREC